MSAEWWRAKDGDGYTSNIDYADPWDITRKQTAREWVATGQEPDMVAALARYNRYNREDAEICSTWVGSPVSPRKYESI